MIISFIIPVKDEEKNVRKLYIEIKKVMNYLIKIRYLKEFEVIFINDGSTDGTQEQLELIKKSEKDKIKIIEFRKNFGKSDAYNAGFKLCKGDLIFTMDGDLQDNPSDITRFINKIREGNDVVIGWKHKRKDPITKKLASKLFNLILRRSTKLKLHDFDNGYRCIRKKVLPHLNLYGGLYRYIPVFASSKGFKVDEVKVDHRKRKHGKSKYGFSRLFGGFFDLITIKFLFYLKRPLHFFGGIGSIFFTSGFLIAAWMTIQKIMMGTRANLLTLASLLMILGLQFLLFGLIGEMITNINKKEKTYSIKSVK